MPTIHLVEPGDCISSLAKQYGFSWPVIWNDGGNADLRARRPDPNILFPGDQVVIPDLDDTPVTRPVDQSHRFRIHNQKTMLKLRLLWLGEPRRDVACTVEVDGRTIRTTTDGDGRLQVSIPSDARWARLCVHGPDGDELQDVSLGELDPHDTVRGFQQRLANLGYDVGEADGAFGPRTAAAMRVYQQAKQQQPTATPDALLRQMLKDDHGS